MQMEGEENLISLNFLFILIEIRVTFTKIAFSCHFINCTSFQILSMPCAAEG